MTDTFADDHDYKLFYQQRLSNPYPLFARLRAQDPVHWCEPMGLWLITRYDDAFVGLRDTKRLSSSRHGMYSAPLTPDNLKKAQPIIEHLGYWLLNVDAPNHTRLRRLVNIAFTPRMLEGLKPRIQNIVDELLDDVCAASETDFVQSFCLPLPAIVICEMLGIPHEKRDAFRQCVDDMIPFSSGGGPGLNDHIDQANAALQRLIDSFGSLIDDRRHDPQDDLLSAMAAAQDNGDRLTKNELFAMCVFLFLAGHETTMGMLASGTLALLRHPDQYAQLRADPDGLVESAVEEILRYEASVTRGVRQAMQDFEWRGKHIKKGQTIMMAIGAANRDPEQFPNPDTFDITRHPNKHLSFGFGSHFCLGAPLARIEGHIAFGAMMRRIPNMALAMDEVEYQPALGIRSIKALHVRVEGRV